MRLWMIRHGQTTGDVGNRYGGAYDDHLTVLGRTQSAALARTLLGTGLSVIYSSPLIRALETADIVAAATGIPRQVLPQFRECNRYGILSGMTKQEALEVHPAEVARAADLHQTVTGAEPYADFKERVTGSFQHLCGGQSDARIALVTHGGVFRVLFREVLGMGEASISDCALATLNFGDGGFEVIGLHGISVSF